jgi:hypothetical protein
MAQVSDADKRHRAPLGETEDRLDLTNEHLHVIADAAGAIRAQMGQILAKLRGVDPSRTGESLTRYCLVALLGEVMKRTQILRQASHGRFG